MRVIAGRLGGRTFESPRSQRTHPMSDKIRGAIFNILGDISGMTILDACAGSGALAIESISRGAKRAVAVDIDQSAARCIEENIRKLEINSRMSCFRLNVLTWSYNNPGILFDIVFIDLPYDELQPKLLDQLVNHLSDKSLLVVSWPGKIEPPKIKKLQVIHSKQYGDAAIYIFELVGAD